MYFGRVQARVYIRAIQTSTIALFSRSWEREKRKWTRRSTRSTLATTGCWPLRNSTTSCVSKRRVASSLLLLLRLALSSFLLCLDEINSQLEKFAAGENVAYRCDNGGGWCVSVTSGFTCVDLRQFYQPFGQLGWKPTRTGIALRLSEWETSRKVIIDDVRRNHSIVANFTPCFLNENHTTVEGMQTCRECNQYSSSLSPIATTTNDI